MWFKSARPAALVASVLAYGAVNKSLLQNKDLIEENVDTSLSLELKKTKAREAIERQMALRKAIPPKRQPLLSE